MDEASRRVRRTELSPGAFVDYFEQWLPQAAADGVLQQLQGDVQWEQREIVLFGKRVLQPRLIAWAGELPYRYSGQTLPPRPWHGAVASVCHDLTRRLGLTFNHALLNRYRDGSDSMGLHADNEPELGEMPQVATLSLGLARRFVIKARRGNSQWQWDLSHGSLLAMRGRCQLDYVHGVPKQSRVTAERISVTFRHVLCAPGER